MKETYQQILKSTVTIATIIIILLGPILFYTYNEQYWASQLSKNGAYTKLGKERAVNLSKNIINYLQGKEDLSYQFTEKEKTHMEDVKKLFTLATALIAISTILLIIAIAIAFKTSIGILRLILKGMLIACIASLILLALILLLTILNFGWLFTAFHETFFPQGNWTFPYESLLITLMPESFFSTIATYIFTTSAIIALILAATSYISLKKNNPRIKKTRRKR